MRIALIAGAAGNLGANCAHCAALRWSLRLLDIDDQGEPNIIAADLSVWNDGWMSAFAGVDAVVHLAGNPSPEASWADV